MLCDRPSLTCVEWSEWQMAVKVSCAYPPAALSAYAQLAREALPAGLSAYAELERELLPAAAAAAAAAAA